MLRAMHFIPLVLAIHAWVLGASSLITLEEPSRMQERLTDDNRDAVIRDIHIHEHPFKPVLVEKRGKLFKKTYTKWRAWTYHRIPRVFDFPRYRQHKCCGCLSGCGPVGWAMVFGYYDRLAHVSPAYGYSKKLYRCFKGVWGSPACKAPKLMTSKVRKYIEAIRKEVKTKCRNGVGGTNAKGMGKIQTWYRARQGLEAYISSYWRLLSYNLGIPQGWIRDRGSKAIRHKYPVLFSFWTDKKKRHIAAALKYKRRIRKWRWCIWRLFARKWGCFGKWRTQQQKRFWMNMGWGGYKNGWWNIKPYAAFVARRG